MRQSLLWLAVIFLTVNAALLSLGVAQAQPPCPPLLCSWPVTQTAIAAGGDATATGVPSPTSTPTPTAALTAAPSLTSTLTPSPTATAPSGPSHGPSTWTEDWTHGLGNWQNSTTGQPLPASCASILNGTLRTTEACGQAFSAQTWDSSYPVVVSGTVRGQPGYPGSQRIGLPDDHDATTYFCGLAVLADQDHYGQGALGRGVAPTNGATATYSWNPGPLPTIIWWADEVGGPYYPYQRVYGVFIDDWQQFTVRWTPDGLGGGSWTGRWTGRWVQDGLVHDTDLPQIPKPQPGPLRVDLQGGPLGPGACEFGPVTVTGVRQ